MVSRQTNRLKIAILGNDRSVEPLRKALENIFLLMGVEISKNAEGTPDILLLIEIDGYLGKLKNILEPCTDKAALIYLYSVDTPLMKHNLYFLTTLLPTYRIPLEQFSIVELARIIADIKADKT